MKIVVVCAFFRALVCDLDVWFGRKLLILKLAEVSAAITEKCPGSRAMLEGKQGPLELTCENMLVDAILGDRDLMDLLDLWVTSRLTNMHVERLFARLRKASPSKHPNLERVCSAGYCSEVLQEHYQAGGLHPSVVTRQEFT